jgi:uracil-DNA glycosylase family 4
MNEPREAIRQYVQFLREREGVRTLRLTQAAQQGLKKLAAKASPAAAPLKPEAATPDRPKLKPDSFTAVKPATGSLPKNIVAWTPSGPAVLEELPVEEVAGSTKAEQLQHLAARASVCVKCPHLAARRHTVVFGVGDPDARLMFVGEGPGEEEDLKGEPFVGRAGQLLTKMIAAMGLSREQVYIANVVKCRPDMPPGVPGNRKPTRQEMETCVPYLRAQIEVIQPAAMVALGATAIEGLLGPVGTIGSLRGTFLEYRGTPLMPTYHPSYLLRNQSNTEKRKVWEDLLQVMERLEMPISDKQRGFFLKG